MPNVCTSFTCGSADARLFRVSGVIGSVPYAITRSDDVSCWFHAPDISIRLRKVGEVGSVCTRCAAMARQTVSGSRVGVVTSVPPLVSVPSAVSMPPM